MDISVNVHSVTVPSIKVLTIGDPHFKVDNILESEEMTRNLIKLAKTIQPKFIVVLGDTLHKHEVLNTFPLMKAEHMILLLSEIAPTFVLIGNHDRPNNSTYMTNEHPFNALKLWKNTYIVDEKVVDANIAGLRFLFVPYVFPGRFEETLFHTEKGVKEPYKNTAAIFCHQEFFGAKMGAIKSQVGDKWPTTNPLVISGHIHDYDKLQPNLIYVGTPMQHAFNETCEKAISVFTFFQGNTDEKKWEELKWEELKWEESRVDLGLIKKVIIYLTPEKVHTYQPPTDKLIKIVIKGDDASLKAISKLEQIKEWKKIGIKISYKTISSIDSEDKKYPTLKMGYKDRLYTTICKDAKQLEWFNKMFK